ncbi:hypothetical protein N5T57_10715, partial [Aliarcobacter cryaerophilus]|uniref:hypothetical protein n=1 Tax=Aliarcobacter cryaerophilus TaxID=28198 RepID=UPI0021B2EEED
FYQIPNSVTKYFCKVSISTLLFVTNSFYQILDNVTNSFYQILDNVTKYFCKVLISTLLFATKMLY